MHTFFIPNNITCSINIIIFLCDTCPRLHFFACFSCLHTHFVDYNNKFACPGMNFEHNYTFSWLLYAYCTPFLLFHRKITHLLGQVLLFFFSPPLAAFYLCSLYYAFFSSQSPNIAVILQGGSVLFTEGIILAYNSWHFVGSWLFPFGCVVVWPVWLMGWALGCQTIHDKETTTVSSHPHSDWWTQYISSNY